MSEPQAVDTSVLQSRTVGGAKRFIETKTRSYEIPASSGGAMVTALKKVFDVDLNADDIDLGTVDLDDTFARFRIKSAELTDQSFAAYKSRVRRAIAMYTKWLDGEPWKGSANGKSTKKVVTGRFAKPTSSGKDSSESTAIITENRMPTDSNPPADSVLAPVSAESELFPYRVFLVDANVTVTLQLPPTYTARDAAKITGLINALATPDA